ncbi:MAG: hypothetical protein LQ352_005401 [Teloschistes flavicans]|nr:MAG: hypothetical protein LQ352_005401 [Teloschistes flavicans]
MFMATRLTAQRLVSASNALLAARSSRVSLPVSRLNQISQHTGRNMASTYNANGDNGDLGSTGGELNEWKHRAPYRVHDQAEHFKARYEASCHCGKVKYRLSREKPLDSKYCHCTTCQKLHGAPFQWAAIFHKDDINFTHGHHDLGWYESSEKTCVHKLPCKVSCAYCRTPIMDEGRNMILLFPTLIDFKTPEDRKNFDISCHMFYPRRVLDIPDGKPKWSGINNSSDLIEDSPQEAVNELKRKRQEEEDTKDDKKS